MLTTATMTDRDLTETTTMSPQTQKTTESQTTVSPHISNRELLSTTWTWAGNIRPYESNVPNAFDRASPLDIKTRIAAVQASGLTSVGLCHADIAAIRDRIGLQTFKRQLNDAGIHYIEMEFIADWWTCGATRAVSDGIRQTLFEAAAILGVTVIKVGAEVSLYSPPPHVGADRFASEFDALATDAAQHGVRVAIEPMPMSNLRTIRDGADFVRKVGNPNGGLCVDIWHVARGGTAYADLPKILTNDQIFVVELNDADKFIVNNDLWLDTIDYRKLPGEGVLNVADFIATVYQIGFRGRWGVEIISAAYRKLPLADALQAVCQSTGKVFDEAEKILASRSSTH